MLTSEKRSETSRLRGKEQEGGRQHRDAGSNDLHVVPVVHPDLVERQGRSQEQHAHGEDQDEWVGGRSPHEVMLHPHGPGKRPGRLTGSPR
jgi:hypothetical protein